MKILAFDTATSATAVALLDTDADAVIQRRDDPAPGERPRHTTRLMALIVDVLEEAGADWGEVDRLAVGIGPGTFTGLRIGIATAHALARARGIPLVGVCTLHALARGAADCADAGGEEAIMAVIDARRGEVFAAGWSIADARRADGRPLVTPAALAPDALADELRSTARRWLAVGDGAVEFRPALERSGARIPEEDSERNRVSAVEHCRLAAGMRPEAPEASDRSTCGFPTPRSPVRAARQR